MKKLIIPFVLFAVLFSMSCCDKIDDPIIENDFSFNDSIPVPEFFPVPDSLILKNVMIEDFTAHQCGNCPEAAIIADEIHADNPNRVSVVAVHAGTLAVTGEDHYTVDWTCEESEIYYSQLDFQANPLGRINRAPNLGAVHSKDDWSDRTQEQMDEDPVAVLQMVADFVPEENQLNVHVFTEFIQDFTSEVKLVLLITESGLSGNQLDYSQDPTFIEEYEFEHLLRGTVTGALGLGIGDSFTAGDEVIKSYSYNFPIEWVAANCSVVAFVYDNTTGALLNVIERHVDE